jgi:hypothetical protein
MPIHGILNDAHGIILTAHSRKRSCSTQCFCCRVSCSFTEVRKDACFILGLLAVKPEYQHQIAAARALPGRLVVLSTRCCIQCYQTSTGCCIQCYHSVTESQPHMPCLVGCWCSAPGAAYSVVGGAEHRAAAHSVTHRTDSSWWRLGHCVLPCWLLVVKQPVAVSDDSQECSWSAGAVFPAGLVGWSARMVEELLGCLSSCQCHAAGVVLQVW